MEANMIKKFGKKGHKEIKKLLDKRRFFMIKKTCLSLKRKETLL
jgi:hypothetical protein